MNLFLLDKIFPYHISNKIYHYHRQENLKKINEIIIYKTIFLYYKEHKKSKTHKLTWIVCENQNYYKWLDCED